MDGSQLKTRKHSMVEYSGGSGEMVGKKKGKKNKRRFSEEQVKWLEGLFENESKLEGRQKVEAARELGLHPRQVAIWFQNKRARWKSKLLQRDFDSLRSDYDSLSSRFDALSTENLSLSLQVQKLKELVGDIEEGDNSSGSGSGRSSVVVRGKLGGVNDQEWETNGSKLVSAEEVEEEKKGELVMDEYRMRMGMGNDYLAMEGELVAAAMVEPACSSLTSDEEWHGLHSDGLFDQSPSSSQWWDFWP